MSIIGIETTKKNRILLCIALTTATISMRRGSSSGGSSSSCNKIVQLYTNQAPKNNDDNKKREKNDNKKTLQRIKIHTEYSFSEKWTEQEKNNNLLRREKNILCACVRVHFFSFGSLCFCSLQFALVNEKRREPNVNENFFRFFFKCFIKKDRFIIYYLWTDLCKTAPYEKETRIQWIASYKIIRVEKCINYI